VGAAHRFCRTRPIGEIEQFGDCLASRPKGCPYAIGFGYGTLCSHRRWRDFISCGHAIANRFGLGVTFPSEKWDMLLRKTDYMPCELFLPYDRTLMGREQIEELLPNWASLEWAPLTGLATVEATSRDGDIAATLRAMPSSGMAHADLIEKFLGFMAAGAPQ